MLRTVLVPKTIAQFALVDLKYLFVRSGCWSVRGWCFDLVSREHLQYLTNQPFHLTKNGPREPTSKS